MLILELIFWWKSKPVPVMNLRGANNREIMSILALEILLLHFFKVYFGILGQESI